MKRLTYLERMKLLDDIEIFNAYFYILKNMAVDNESFDIDEFNKNLNILNQLVKDVKS